MNLHKCKPDFDILSKIVADYYHISVANVKRDYYIVMILKNLSASSYSNLCVFKGGTSLSKCYPGSINRFSEDIDLTFMPNDELNSKEYDKKLKKIESILSDGFETEKIDAERNDRNKSSWVWYKDENKDDLKVKLEIGSKIRPDPYHKAIIRTYLQEYLTANNMIDTCIEYGLDDVVVNVLNIERTFLDKVMSVKRHAICGTLKNKTRHIYDVIKLFEREDIQGFLIDKANLKLLLSKTKETDSFYLQKRNVSVEYNPLGNYDFDSWKEYLDINVQSNYIKLSDNLLFDKNTKLDFDKVFVVFNKLNEIFKEINE